MTSRILYVNTQGLNGQKWALICGFFDAAPLDYMFIAETWQWNRWELAHDRRVVCMTEYEKPTTPVVTRPRGGIYLLAKPRAKGWMTNSTVGKHHITVSTNLGAVITAVYLPPSMTEDLIASTFLSVRHSSIILGDINVRFDDPDHQEGRPGPHPRLRQVLDALRPLEHVRSHAAGVREFIDAHAGQAPRWSLGDRFTLDHCFTSPAVRSNCRLFLVHTSNLGIKTDHRFALYMVFSGVARSDLPPAVPTLKVRFRVNRLEREPPLEGLLRRAFRLRCLASSDALDPDEQDSALVTACQDAATLALGRISSDRHAPPKQADFTPRTLHVDESIRLYRSAMTRSDENDYIVPTPDATLDGVSALTENYEALRSRYAGPSFVIPDPSPDPHVLPFDPERIVAEIGEQSSRKSAGRDGVHMKIIKALSAEPCFVDALCSLFRRCLSSGRTPSSWNRTDIYLLIKDKRRRKDVHNLRPITLICMFRKLFEKLLLETIDHSGWARLHPCQTGFRDHHSTCSTAAVAHHLLSSGRANVALFVDFRTAFDVVDHRILYRKLLDRDCPPHILALIVSLNFGSVESTAYVNDFATPGIPRRRGVLQGSPISPLLFNIFIDDLVAALNGDPGVPSLFYADDGTIFGDCYAQIHRRLAILTSWCATNGIAINVSKCGHVTKLEPQPLEIDGRLVRVVDEYNYLGFPISADGIDFGLHLGRRIDGAVGMTRFLAVRSDAWGPSHRLWVAKQILTPMFEYGAPLVSAWLQQSAPSDGKEDDERRDERLKLFGEVTKKHRQLLGWIAHCSGARWKVIANLCGLPDLLLRFSDLLVLYRLRLDALPDSHPLLSAMARPDASGFLLALRRQKPTKRSRPFGYGDSKDLVASLRIRREAALASDAKTKSVLSVILPSSRLQSGHRCADVVFSAPIICQERLFQYRIGNWMFGRACKCTDDDLKRSTFRRGHENCYMLPRGYRLTKAERQRKLRMQKELGLKTGQIFTDVDFLLNIGRFESANQILETTYKALNKEYKEILLDEALNAETLPNDSVPDVPFETTPCYLSDKDDEIAYDF